MVTSGRNITRRRVRGYAPWSPQPKSLEIVEQVRAVLSEYRNLLPLTNRQVFYRLVGRFGYPKDDRAYERLCNYINRARRAGMIPFGHIRDDGASFIHPEHFSDENDFYRHIGELGENYEVDKLANQEVAIRVYCESAGMMPQLSRTLEPYSVPVYSGGGFDSTTAKYELARTCARNHTWRGKRTIIFHLGDYDPSGESIFESMIEDVHAFLGRDVPHVDPDEVAHFQRVALMEHQVRLFDLPTAPPKRSDGRTRSWQGSAACQLEALPPDMLAHLLRYSVEAELDLEVLKEDRKAEVTSRRNIMRALPPGDAA